jgi:hypothetical protein
MSRENIDGARPHAHKFVPRSYWLDTNDPQPRYGITQGTGGHLTHDQKRAHLIDLKREHLFHSEKR